MSSARLQTALYKVHAINLNIVKLREREGQRVDLGRSLKGHLWMVDGGYPFPDALHYSWLPPSHPPNV